MISRSKLRCATIALGMVLAAAVVPSLARADEDGAMKSLLAMSDSLKAANSFAFSAGVFFNEQSPNGLKVKRYARYEVSVRHPDKLAWSVAFDDGTSRKGAFDGKEVVFAHVDTKSYTRIPFEGSVDELIDHLSDKYAIGLPISDFIHRDILAAHKPYIVNATKLGDRVLPETTVSHLLVEGSVADWQIWIVNNETALPIRFVATYARRLGDPEYMITFWEWTLNRVKDSDLELHVPSDWKKIEIAAPE